MRQFILVLVAGLTATALSVGAVNADPPQAVTAPTPGTTGTAAPAPSTPPSPYQFYNGYWWYRMPDGRWLYYSNGKWMSPSPPAQAGAPVYAYPNYVAAPGPYYYPYDYGYPDPYYGGGLYIGGGWGWGGGGWHGGYHR
jgi:hypothetical protein